MTLNESWDDFDSKSELITFYRSWIEEAYRVMKDNACICIWGDRRNIFYVQPILEEYFPKFILTPQLNTRLRQRILHLQPEIIF